jgi:hypothetical protein
VHHDVHAHYFNALHMIEHIFARVNGIQKIISKIQKKTEKLNVTVGLCFEDSSLAGCELLLKVNPDPFNDSNIQVDHVLSYHHHVRIMGIRYRDNII